MFLVCLFCLFLHGQIHFTVEQSELHRAKHFFKNVWLFDLLITNFWKSLSRLYLSLMPFGGNLGRVVTWSQAGVCPHPPDSLWPGLCRCELAAWELACQAGTATIAEQHHGGRRGHLFNPAGWVCPVSCNYRLGLDPTGINTNSKMKSKVTKSNKTMKSIDKNGLLFQIDWTAVQTTDAFLFMLKLALIFTNYFAQTLHCHFHKSFVRW